jgi:hypothetical protein
MGAAECARCPANAITARSTSVGAQPLRPPGGVSPLSRVAGPMQAREGMRARSLAAVAALSMSACQAIQGNGVAASEDRLVAPFDAVLVSGNIPAQVSMGPTHVAVSGDENLLRYVVTDVSHDRLSIYSQAAYQLWPRIDLLTIVSTPMVSALDVTGSADALATGLDCDMLSSTVSGSGPLTLSGKAGSVELVITGSGSVDARDLHATNVDVTVTGSGSVDVCATGLLNVVISGSGSVGYACHPVEVHRTLTGSGSMIPR